MLLSSRFNEIYIVRVQSLLACHATHSDPSLRMKDSEPSKPFTASLDVAQAEVPRPGTPASATRRASRNSRSAELSIEESPQHAARQKIAIPSFCRPRQRACRHLFVARHGHTFRLRGEEWHDLCESVRATRVTQPYAKHVRMRPHVAENPHSRPLSRSRESPRGYPYRLQPLRYSRWSSLLAVIVVGDLHGGASNSICFCARRQRCPTGTARSTVRHDPRS